MSFKCLKLFNLNLFGINNKSISIFNYLKIILRIHKMNFLLNYLKGKKNSNLLLKAFIYIFYTFLRRIFHLLY